MEKPIKNKGFKWRYNNNAEFRKVVNVIDHILAVVSPVLMGFSILLISIFAIAVYGLQSEPVKTAIAAVIGVILSLFIAPIIFSKHKINRENTIHRYETNKELYEQLERIIIPSCCNYEKYHLLQEKLLREFVFTNKEHISLNFSTNLVCTILTMIDELGKTGDGWEENYQRTANSCFTIIRTENRTDKNFIIGERMRSVINAFYDDNEENN